jgi:hypothetical protein
MSLITDPVMIALWKEAQIQGPSEWASVAVWNQLWTKHIFWEKEWVVCPETPPEGKGRRRVDLTIKYLGGDGALAVLTFHEVKPLDASPQEIEEVEHQALEACMRYLGKEENKELESVYAFTSFGTKGRAWRYIRDEDYLSPLFGSKDLAERQDYIELHSTDAQLLRVAFNTMRNVKPSA